MALTFQQLRNSGAGVKPGDLEPGQLAFNLSDSKGYLGNGTNAKTLADGSTGSPAPTAGKGWLEFSLKAGDIADLLTKGAAPAVVKDSRAFGTAKTPSAGQVLTWDAAADGGAGGYVPTTPGTTAVYSVANNSAALNASSGSTTGDLVAGLIAGTSITAKGDLHAGDIAIVTDSGSADASSSVGPGTYIYDGTSFHKGPSGGGASNLGDLLNVNTAAGTVAAANQNGLIVRDGSVATETNAGAYKLITVIDCGTY
jgi:hypothetical protein